MTVCFIKYSSFFFLAWNHLKKKQITFKGNDQALLKQRKM